jgi:hypothetical protein
MNFDEAIKAHADWKMKLARYIQRPDRSIDAGVVGQDNQCSLGRWLHGEGVRFASMPEFAQLRQEHAAFHRHAADIVRRADSGEKVVEDVSLGAESPYSKTSIKLTQLIMSLRRKL